MGAMYTTKEQDAVLRLVAAGIDGKLPVRYLSMPELKIARYLKVKGYIEEYEDTLVTGGTIRMLRFTSAYIRSKEI
jgi:hypothetical protein